jgi:large subunit ribosomal protein L37Ae
MSKAKKGVGPAKRFGVRYGLTNRQRVGVIEAEQKKDHKCPYCHFMKVSRESVGIWSCSKCGAKFTAKAYKPLITKKLKTETNKDLISELGDEEQIITEEVDEFEDLDDDNIEDIEEDVDESEETDDLEDIEEDVDDLENIDDLDETEELEDDEELSKSKKKTEVE